MFFTNGIADFCRDIRRGSFRLQIVSSILIHVTYKSTDQWCLRFDAKKNQEESSFSGSEWKKGTNWKLHKVSSSFFLIIRSFFCLRDFFDIALWSCDAHHSHFFYFSVKSVSILWKLLFCRFSWNNFTKVFRTSNVELLSTVGKHLYEKKNEKT